MGTNLNNTMGIHFSTRAPKFSFDSKKDWYVTRVILRHRNSTLGIHFGPGHQRCQVGPNMLLGRCSPRTISNLVLTRPNRYDPPRQLRPSKRYVMKRCVAQLTTVDYNNTGPYPHGIRYDAAIRT